MKTLQLSNSDKVAIIDDEDYERLKTKTWRFRKRVYSWYQTIYKTGGSKTRSLACFVMNDFESLFDHKDRNPLNNQKYNLRKCNTSQNNTNRIKQKNTTSKYKGVYWSKKRLKWYSMISKNKKTTYLGYFINEIKAAKAYNNAAIKLHGEFANLNIIEEVKLD